jgi:hypothetical protein
MFNVPLCILTFVDGADPSLSAISPWQALRIDHKLFLEIERFWQAFIFENISVEILHIANILQTWFAILAGKKSWLFVLNLVGFIKARLKQQ